MTTKTKAMFIVKYVPGFEIEYAMMTGKSIPMRNRKFIVDFETLPAKVRAFIYQQANWQTLRDAEYAMECNVTNDLMPQVFVEVELDAGCTLIGKKNLASVLRKTIRQIAEYTLVDVTVQSVRIDVYQSATDSRNTYNNQDVEFFQVVE